jgi:hypothetical protein
MPSDKGCEKCTELYKKGSQPLPQSGVDAFLTLEEFKREVEKHSDESGHDVFAYFRSLAEAGNVR